MPLMLGFLFFLKYRFDSKGNLTVGSKWAALKLLPSKCCGAADLTKSAWKATQELGQLEVIWLLTSSNAEGLEDGVKAGKNLRKSHNFFSGDERTKAGPRSHTTHSGEFF